MIFYAEMKMSIGFDILKLGKDVIVNEVREWETARKDFVKLRKAEKDEIQEELKKAKNKGKIGFQF